ncbi:MAG TPA: 16S rRNA (guanine(527)-N(7))-methyltransferase RsmG [Burkholderiaceae bacterium]|nr:16S rRNA (guanine(527)-N(7))-methyltransferase RsmG [Burkholderiaceae bacterium]
MRSLEPELRAGLDQLALPLTDTQIGLCLDYLDLLGKWSKVYNLTAIRDPQEMLTHHLLDSLAVVAPLRRQLQQLYPSEPRPLRLLDVGAGAGLPGVLIAIACPEVTVTCVDTVAKKAAFIQQAAGALRLPNLRGLHARVETLVDSYDVISARAFSSLVDFVNWSGTALAPHGIWLAMKGKHPSDEMATLQGATQEAVEVFHVEQLTVPGLDAERCILWMRKKAA